MLTMRIETVSPGALSAGAAPTADVGLADDTPLVLVGIIREGSGSANGTISLTRPSATGNKEVIFEDVVTSSRLFDPGLSGGRILWSVPVMPGRPLSVRIKASGSVPAETWYFLFAPLTSGDRLRGPVVPPPRPAAAGQAQPQQSAGGSGGMVTL